MLKHTEEWFFTDCFNNFLPMGACRKLFIGLTGQSLLVHYFSTLVQQFSHFY